MITDEAQEKLKSLLDAIHDRGEEVASVIEGELDAGRLDDSVVQTLIAHALNDFYISISMLYSGAEHRYERPETVGLVPESDLPDFSLSVPEGTPDN